MQFTKYFSLISKLQRLITNLCDKCFQIEAKFSDQKIMTFFSISIINLCLLIFTWQNDISRKYFLFSFS